MVDEHLKARPIDLTSMKWSLDDGGNGTGTAALDVGQFVTQLYDRSEGSLSWDEVHRLKNTFLTEYFKSSPVSQTMMQPGADLYGAEFQLARIEHDLGDPCAAFAALVDNLGMTPHEGGGK